MTAFASHASLIATLDLVLISGSIPSPDTASAKEALKDAMTAALLPFNPAIRVEVALWDSAGRYKLPMIGFRGVQTYTPTSPNVGGEFEEDVTDFSLDFLESFLDIRS